jgi:hypothetical protein
LHSAAFERFLRCVEKPSEAVYKVLEGALIAPASYHRNRRQFPLSSTEKPPENLKEVIDESEDDGDRDEAQDVGFSTSKFKSA